MTWEIVYADFPWPRTPFGTAKTPYTTMTWEKIRDWDWKPWMAERCILFLWSTSPTHLQEMVIFNHWCEQFGLRFLGIPFVWVKTTKDGKPLGATGPRPRLVKPQAEYVVALTNVKRGRPFPLLTESMEQWIMEPRQEHSRKPAVVRDRIVELVGDRPRIELFSREHVPGWDGWGNQYPSSARNRLRALAKFTGNQTDVPTGNAMPVIDT